MLCRGRASGLGPGQVELLAQRRDGAVVLPRELAPRSIRTLDVFLTELVGATGGALPPNFVVTLPKITAVDDVETLVWLFG